MTELREFHTTAVGRALVAEVSWHPEEVEVIELREIHHPFQRISQEEWDTIPPETFQAICDEAADYPL